MLPIKPKGAKKEGQHQTEATVPGNIQCPNPTADGKLDQLTRKAAALPTDIVAV